MPSGRVKYKFKLYNFMVLLKFFILTINDDVPPNKILTLEVLSTVKDNNAINLMPPYIFSECNG